MTEILQLMCDVIKSSDLKQKFFAQYYGQKVMYVGGVGLVEVGTGGWNMKHPNFFLELKSLSELTDEDYAYVSKLYCKPIFKNKEDYIERLNKYGIVMVEEIDYLRIKGYALPFGSYSVEDLVKGDWLRIIQNTK